MYKVDTHRIRIHDQYLSPSSLPSKASTLQPPNPLMRLVPRISTKIFHRYIIIASWQAPTPAARFDAVCKAVMSAVEMFTFGLGVTIVRVLVICLSIYVWHHLERSWKGGFFRCCFRKSLRGVTTKEGNLIQVYKKTRADRC